MPLSINHLLALEWKTWASRNNPVDAIPVNIFAYSDSVTTDNKTIWDGLPATYAFPSSASTMGISSSVTNDSGGIVAISGLDSNWNMISETVILNGTPPVATTNSYYRINSLSMITPAVGHNTNVGIISAKGGATTYGQINAGIGTMQAGWYSIPSEYSLFIYEVDCYSGDVVANGKYATFNAQITNHNVVRPMKFKLLQSTFSNSFRISRVIPQVRTEKSDIEWQFSVSQGTHSVSLIVQAFLLKNAD
jgi:hypothetical protein